MNDTKYVVSEIRNSKTLTYLNNEMLANRKALADALLQRAKDFEQLQQLQTQVDQQHNDLCGILSMLGEICHNIDNPRIKKLYMERYETP